MDSGGKKLRNCCGFWEEKKRHCCGFWEVKRKAEWSFWEEKIESEWCILGGENSGTVVDSGSLK